MHQSCSVVWMNERWLCRSEQCRRTVMKRCRDLSGRWIFGPLQAIVYVGHFICRFGSVGRFLNSPAISTGSFAKQISRRDRRRVLSKIGCTFNQNVRVAGCHSSRAHEKRFASPKRIKTKGVIPMPANGPCWARRSAARTNVQKGCSSAELPDASNAAERQAVIPRRHVATEPVRAVRFGKAGDGVRRIQSVSIDTRGCPDAGTLPFTAKGLNAVPA